MPQIAANGLKIEYDTFGDERDEPLLLIMGIGAQMVRWSPTLCGKLAAKGFRVIRFDNRDVGLSEKLDVAGAPDVPAIFAARSRGETPAVPYLLSDMADDAVGLLTALGIERAHIVGMSMGGMIAQLVAADHPGRTLSLTSIMSTTGHASLPPGSPEAMAVLFTPAPDPHSDLEAYLDHAVQAAKVIGSPAYPTADETLRARAREWVARAYHPVGFSRQMAAVLASPDRRAKLAGVTAPTAVIHGDSDPLVHPDGGRDTAACIPGATLKIIPGMGHDLPEALYDEIVEAIAEVAARARLAA
jgi:pimeloyl-ACP methyl ester carboxylesterase